MKTEMKKDWALFLGRLWVGMFSVCLIIPDSAEATQKPRRMASKTEDSPIVGESDESETTPTDEEGEEDETEEEADAVKPSKKPKGKGGLKPNKEKSAAEKAKEAKAAQKRDRWMLGFKKAESFHKSWFNLPSEKILSSHKNLTKFCKAACTKIQCMDEEIANNCHLMCPEATRKQCADPLKMAGDDEVETLETTPNDEDDFPGSISVTDMSSSSSVSSSLGQADQALAEGEGEGG